MTTNYKQGLEPLVCNEPKILILGSRLVEMKEELNCIQ